MIGMDMVQLRRIDLDIRQIQEDRSKPPLPIYFRARFNNLAQFCSSLTVGFEHISLPTIEEIIAFAQNCCGRQNQPQDQKNIQDEPSGLSTRELPAVKQAIGKDQSDCAKEDDK